MINVMIDLETMGTSGESAIIAIGAVKFRLEDDLTLDEFYRTIDLQSCIDAGMTIDGATVYWWMSQSAEARNALVQPTHKLEGALVSFDDWFGIESLPTWGNGASFDCVLLRNAYRRMNREAPFKFFDERCFRTMRAMHRDVVYEKPLLAHHALADAVAQARHLQKIYKEMQHETID